MTIVDEARGKHDGGVDAMDAEKPMMVQVALDELANLMEQLVALKERIDAFQADIERVTAIVDMRQQQEELRLVHVAQGYHAKMVNELIDRVVVATRKAREAVGK